MNKVTTGIFGGLGVLVIGGAYLSDLSNNLTESVAGIDPGTFSMLIVASIVVWLFYIGTQVSGRGGL